MEKTRILILDASAPSKEARETLIGKKIDFFEVYKENLSRSDIRLPTLLAPEGKFEGANLVKIYSAAESNGFHKKIENHTD